MILDKFVGISQVGQKMLAESDAKKLRKLAKKHAQEIFELDNKSWIVRYN